MNSEPSSFAGAPGAPRTPEVTRLAPPGPGEPQPGTQPALNSGRQPETGLAPGQGPEQAGGPEWARPPEWAGGPELAADPQPDPQPEPGPEGGPLPVMPGFREMGLRRQAGEQAARMAEDRGRLVRELAEQRQAAGLSQTEVAARMGTSQSAVARLESGTADVRASTLERYAAAVGGQITWKLNRPAEAEGASE
jgi:DNA-binding XRE family transcriptional regulator